MSDAASVTDGGQSYSLFFEIAVAVGTTILAMFLCNNRRKNTAIPSENEEVALENKAKQIDDAEIPKKDSAIISEETNSSIDEALYSIETKASRNKTFATTATQTDVSPVEERITWKAVVVDPFENSNVRYRSELYVDTDGVITHSESFQREGIVGVGMKQILAKIQ